jgi:penicillin amidase
MNDRAKRWLLSIGAGLALLGVVAGMGGYAALRASLPRLDGHVRDSKLSAEVQVDRDAAGVPTVRGATREDTAYASGFLHAQDRFFQMDLLRRSAAGELSELLGTGTLDDDKAHRIYRFRARAHAALAAMPPEQRRLLDRYVDGVNAGLRDLPLRPFEYLVLGTEPRPWLAEDTLLVIDAMYLTLQGNVLPREAAREWLRRHSDARQLDVLLDSGDSWQAPLDGDRAETPPPLPERGPSWFAAAAAASAAAAKASSGGVGSNNWAVAGSRTRDGRALVADDMHLALGLPNTWYRMSIEVGRPGASVRRLVGVTLPGTPMLVVGSNGDVAWGFTNAYADTLDLVRLHRDPSDSSRYAAGGAWERAQVHRETIQVKGEKAIELTVEETRYGPVQRLLDDDFAIHWTALDPGAANLRFLDMEDVRDVDDAMRVAGAAGLPTQNMLAVDRGGRIGWTLAGALPARDATTGTTFPLEPGATWTQLRTAGDRPRIVNPPSGQLWSANNRQLSGTDYARIGDGGALIGVRARQVRDRLSELRGADEASLMSVAMDTSARFMSAWREQALTALSRPSMAGEPRRAEFKRLLESAWDGHADRGSAGYPLARAYLSGVYVELFGSVDRQLEKAALGATMDTANTHFSDVALRLLRERPAGWLPEGTSWDDVERHAVDRAIAKLTSGGRTLREANWGDLRHAHIVHPLADALPLGSRWLAAPPDPLPGDDNMPRVSEPDFGQSERLVVAPGHEQDGLFNMPGGQSGHPLSPFFLAGHDAWVQGHAVPLLPGKTVYRFSMSP